MSFAVPAFSNLRINFFGSELLLAPDNAHVTIFTFKRDSLEKISINHVL